MKYSVKREFYYTEHIGFYFSFSIVCKDDGKIKAKIPDAFLSREAASAFVKACNEDNLDPAHLLDVWEDWD